MSKTARKRKKVWKSKRDGLGATSRAAATANVISAASRLHATVEQMNDAERERIASCAIGMRLLMDAARLTQTLRERERLFNGKGR